MERGIPKDIIKIQKKLASFEKDSRNYQKYSKILAKHVKKHNMQRRLYAHINTIEKMQKAKELSSQK